MAYVFGGGSPSYITEATYRAKGYAPAFERLPTEDEYDAARSCSEKRHADAGCTLVKLQRPAFHPLPPYRLSLISTQSGCPTPDHRQL